MKLSAAATQVLLGAVFVLMTQAGMAQELKWYEHPGHWFRNLLYAPREAQPAPTSLGQTLQGRPASLEDYSGRLLLISFWASWCPLCNKELPQLDQLSKDIGDSRFSVVAVNVRDQPEGMLRWIRQRAWNITYLADQDGAVARSYAISPLPTNVLVDGKTRLILKRWEGDVDVSAIAAEVKRQLEQ
jgi:thiol-disulfide isomerase/thioredoxin